MEKNEEWNSLQNAPKEKSENDKKRSLLSCPHIFLLRHKGTKKDEKFFF
jgi:hypothetical protein